ncbi:YDG/SRA domain-containing protein [Streptomyces sp. NPDC052396]|uniref:YDG/SRA domain-containing protein n=1 Tax=Streptomyces sp. NPDC052396 TaxID=3365689 RepID=UPI0037D59ED1
MPDVEQLLTRLLHSLETLSVGETTTSAGQYQAALVLRAIARAAAGRERLITWQDAENEVHSAFPEYAHTTHHPFGDLPQSPLWELRESDSASPLGGLEADLHDLLARDQHACNQAVKTTLETYFPAKPWEEVLVPAQLMQQEYDGFEHPPYVSPGMHFGNRRALYAANVHRQLQAGIWGKADEEAKSIVVSGGYEDDADKGDEIIYTGQGGQDQNAKKQIHDQDLTKGNAALINSLTTGRPVRVIRGAGGDSPYSPSHGYRYDGLFRVEDAWNQRGASGFRVYRYRLRKLGTDANAATSIPAVTDRSRSGSATDPGTENPGRKETVVQRIVRSTAAANKVKRLHDHTCQICGIRIETPTGAYSEAAHIRGLGRPHNGPDKTENLLCLCPNHHVEFDLGMITIDGDGKVIEHGSTQHGYTLRRLPEHAIDEDYFRYHRETHER